MHYEQIAEENFVMVSTRGVAFDAVTPADYIRANYSAFFNRAHRQMLPELENVPVSTGNGGAVAYLLRSRGGTAFVTETVATKLRQEGVAQLVADAPKISHPIYSAVHVRHHHSHTHVRLLKALNYPKTLLPTHWDNFEKPLSGPPEDLRALFGDPANLDLGLGTR